MRNAVVITTSPLQAASLANPCIPTVCPVLRSSIAIFIGLKKIQERKFSTHSVLNFNHVIIFTFILANITSHPPSAVPRCVIPGSMNLVVYFQVILTSSITVRFSIQPVCEVPGTAVAPQPRFVLSITILESPEPRSARSKVGHEGVGDVVVDTGQVAGVARGGAGQTGAQGVSPALGGLEVSVVETGVLEKSPVVISNN